MTAVARLLGISAHIIDSLAIAGGLVISGDRIVGAAGGILQRPTLRATTELQLRLDAYTVQIWAVE